MTKKQKLTDEEKLAKSKPIPYRPDDKVYKWDFYTKKWIQVGRTRTAMNYWEKKDAESK